MTGPRTLAGRLHFHALRAVGLAGGVACWVCPVALAILAPAWLGLWALAVARLDGGAR